MKSSIKQIAFAVVIAALFLTSQSFAQTSKGSRSARFGVDLSLGTATNATYKSVTGAGIFLQQGSSNVSGILSVGYTTFSLKAGAPGQTYNVIPVKFGFEFSSWGPLYFSAEIGSGLGVKNGARTSFVYSPGLGIGFDNGLDLGLRYEAFTSRVNNSPSQLALRLAYGFKIGKK